MSGIRVSKKAPYFETTVSVDSEVDVEISPEELSKAGWHHKSECAGSEPELPIPLIIGAVSYQDAIASLHRQAHPLQLADPAACHEEPCRSLSFAQLAMVMGRAS